MTKEVALSTETLSPTEVTHRLDALASEIRRHASKANESFFQIGLCLREAQNLHQSKIAYGRWAKRNFPDLHRNTLGNYLRIATLVEETGDRELVSYGIAVLTELARPAVPAEKRQEVIADLKDGKQSSVRNLRKKLGTATTKATRAQGKSFAALMVPALQAWQSSGEQLELKKSELLENIASYPELRLAILEMAETLRSA